MTNCIVKDNQLSENSDISKNENVYNIDLPELLIDDFCAEEKEQNYEIENSIAKNCEEPQKSKMSEIEKYNEKKMPTENQ